MLTAILLLSIVNTLLLGGLFVAALCRSAAMADQRIEDYWNH